MSFVTFKPVINQDLQFEFGCKRYKIKAIRQRVAGDGTKFAPIDLTKLSKVEKDAFSEAAAKAATVFPRIHGDLAGARTFTLTFRQHGQSPFLHEVAYHKGAATHTIKLEGYSETALREIQVACQHLAALIQHVTPQSQGKELVHPLDSAKRDPGSKGNKCAARALALALYPDATDAEITTQSKLLIRSAAHLMLRDPAFVTPDTPQNSALVGAVNGHNEVRKDDQIPVDNATVMRDTYARKMHEDSVSLDVAFFLAGHSSVIILDKEYTFKEALHIHRSTQFASIVVYDDGARSGASPHYFALIPTTDAHREALKQVLPQQYHHLNFCNEPVEADLPYTVEEPD